MKQITVSKTVKRSSQKEPEDHRTPSGRKLPY
jgi:hypothetical protein